VSVGSFSIPVAPPGVSPRAEPLVYVGINCAWMPYITGALTQLLLESTWRVNSREELEIVRGQATDLMNLFNCAILPTLQELCAQPLGGCGEDCMGCCLRYMDNKLQMLNCGVWEDVPGQGAGIFPPPPQPGGGTPQPEPGGCRKYHAQMPATEQWYVPTVVNTGDVITASNFGGASNESGIPTWFCPNGQLFFAGSCQGSGFPSDPTDPLTTGRHQQLIVEINGFFYDLVAGPVTVPSGVINESATVQLNIDDLSLLQGTVTFDIEVCNNAAEPWDLPENLELNSGRWDTDIAGLSGTQSVWTPGVGWSSVDCDNLLGGSGRYNVVFIELVFDNPTTLTHFDYVYDAVVGDLADAGHNLVQAYQGATANTLIDNVPATGDTQTFEWNGSFDSVTRVVILLYGADHSDATCPSTGSATLRHVHLSGTGPFPLDS